MDHTTLATQAAAALASLLLAVLTWASARAARYLRARTESDYWRDTIARLDEAVYDVTSELEQTLVEGFKEANADGKVTAAEARELRELARDEVMSYLGPRGLKLAERVVDRETLEAIVRAKVESAVLRMRKGER